MSNPVGIGSEESIPTPQQDSDIDLYQFLDRYVRINRETIDYILRPPSRAITATTYTVVDEDFLVKADATSNNVTINLPPVAAHTGREIVVKRTDGSGNSVTIDGDGSETIDGATTVSLASQYNFRRLYSDGIEWLIIGE